MHFLFADLHHIRLLQSPEELFFRLRRALPERQTQIWVVGNQFPPRSCVGDRLLRCVARRLIGQRERTEMKDLCLVDQRKIDLGKREAGIRAGLPGEGELALAPRIERYESKRCEHVGRGDHAARFNAGAPQRFEQEPPERIVPHFAEQRGFCAVFCARRKEVCRRAAGVCRHRRVPVRVGRKAGEIDQELAQRGNVQHISLPFRGLRRSGFIRSAA